MYNNRKHNSAHNKTDINLYKHIEKIRRLNIIQDSQQLQHNNIKPHENKCYYVINEDFNGAVDLS